MKLSELAERLDCRLEGDGDVDIVRVARSGRRSPAISRSWPTRICRRTGRDARLGGDSRPLEAARHAVPPTCAVLRADDPYTAFARALDASSESARPALGIDELSAVAGDASLGADVSIGAFVTVGAGAQIGARTDRVSERGDWPRRRDWRRLHHPLARLDSRARHDRHTA